MDGTERSPLEGHAEAPRNTAERRLVEIIYDELTNLAMGRGLQLHGSHHDDDGRWVQEVSGVIDLVALARRMLAATSAKPA